MAVFLFPDGCVEYRGDGNSSVLEVYDSEHLCWIYVGGIVGTGRYDSGETWFTVDDPYKRVWDVLARIDAHGNPERFRARVTKDAP